MNPGPLSSEFPLTGHCIVVTRATTQAQSFCRLLEEQGADVFHFPVLEMVKVFSAEALKGFEAREDTYDGLLFTSANAVRFFMDFLQESGLDSEQEHAFWERLEVSCVGKKTLKALEDFGKSADWIPQKSSAVGMAEELVATERARGRHFLFPCSAIARPELPGILQKAGALVEQLSLYGPQPTDVDPEPLLRRLLAKGVDAITITSPSIGKAVVEKIGLTDLTEFQTVWASIGPTTTQALQELGCEPILEASSPSVEKLVHTMIEFVIQEQQFRSLLDQEE